MRRIRQIIVALLMISPIVANADPIIITTPVTITDQNSYTFGDYIFELVDPTNLQFNLIDDLGPEDFIVSNVSVGGDFTLRRLDTGIFSLLSLRARGFEITTVGGIAIAPNSGPPFQDFDFAGQIGVTDVTSILFSPSGFSGFIQISAFNVEAPEPGTVGLFGIGLFALAFTRRKQAAKYQLSRFA